MDTFVVSTPRYDSAALKLRQENDSHALQAADEFAKEHAKEFAAVEDILRPPSDLPSLHDLLNTAFPLAPAPLVSMPLAPVAVVDTIVVADATATVAAAVVAAEPSAVAGEVESVVVTAPVFVLPPPPAVAAYELPPPAPPLPAKDDYDTLCQQVRTQRKADVEVLTDSF